MSDSRRLSKKKSILKSTIHQRTTPNIVIHADVIVGEDTFGEAQSGMNFFHSPQLSAVNYFFDTLYSRMESE